METKCTAYARNDKVFMYFTDSFGSQKRGVGYPIGSNIIAFIRLDFKNNIDKLFTDYIRLVFNIDLCVTQEDYLQQQKDLVENYIFKMPFLYFSFNTLQDCLDDYINGADYRDKMLKVQNFDKFNLQFADRYQNNPQALYEEFITAIDSRVFERFDKAEIREECTRYHVFLCLKDALICNLEETQRVFKDEMMFIYQKEKAERAEGLTPKQRLFVYDRHRNMQTGKPMFYVGTSHSVKTIAYAEHTPKIEEPKDINSLVDYVKENDLDLIELQELSDFNDLMRFEMMKLVESNVVISQCEHCGNLFIPRGRKDMQFCHMVIPELGKTCAEVGAYKKYNQKVKENPIYEAFNKAYKRNNSKVRNKKMTNKDFLDWSEEAREKREMCVKGELTLEEYNTWLGNKR